MSKYEGHTPGPWRFDVKRGKVLSDGKTDAFGNSYSVAFEVGDKDGPLIADAPQFAEENERLRAELEDAATSIETLSVAGTRDASLSDLVDVRGFANSRAGVVRKALLETLRDLQTSSR